MNRDVSHVVQEVSWVWRSFLLLVGGELSSAPPSAPACSATSAPGDYRLALLGELTTGGRHLGYRRISTVTGVDTLYPNGPWAASSSAGENSRGGRCFGPAGGYVPGVGGSHRGKRKCPMISQRVRQSSSRVMYVLCMTRGCPRLLVRSEIMPVC